MHEYPFAEEVLRMALETARSHQATKVTSIRLVVSERSGLASDSMRLYFDILTAGTLCEGTRLEIVPVPAAATMGGPEVYVQDIEIET